MDITKFPKFLIWISIFIFIVFVLYFGYTLLAYRFSKPYEKYLFVDCFYSNGTSTVIFTAKDNIKNIAVYDINLQNKCEIKILYKDSMDLCKINNVKEGEKVFIKINFEVNNKTYSAVSECKIEEKKSLLNWLFGKQ
ncbi:MAG: hypothetical protein QW038_00675 [Nanopusillaceae archaeon]